MGLFFKKRSDDIIGEVKAFLENDLIISKKACGMSEDTVEKSLVPQLKEKFGKDNVKNQCIRGENLKLKCDIDMFSGKCGIELKVAHHLTRADEFQRAIGQVACYSQDQYRNTGIILLVVGKNAEIPENIDKLKTIVGYFPRVHFVYKQAANKT